VTHRLLALLQQNNDAPGEVTLSPGATLTGRAALERIATELRHPAPEKVVAAGASMLRNLRRRDVILGTRRDDSAASPPSPSA
jgi:hypothetical protein